jgi:vancomycin resistance protein VanW
VRWIVVTWSALRKDCPDVEDEAVGLRMKSGMSRRKSFLQTVDHRLRRAGLQGARLASWWLSPDRWPPPQRVSSAGGLDVLRYEAVVPLRRDDPFAEPALEAGKRHNVARAAPRFDGIVVAPGRPLSFWRALGRAGVAQGYTWGMELRGGCVTPAIGGGLCLLSNALFAAAVLAGWRILEQHSHSLEAVPPAAGSLPLDATVAWPDVDLVLEPVDGPARLSLAVEGDVLRLAIFAASAAQERIELSGEETVVERGGERVRHSRVVRRRIRLDDASVVRSDEVVRSERRIVPAHELGRSCISCGETTCADRPAEPVLVALRGRAAQR